MKIDWLQVRASWRRKAKKWATTRHPNGCTCFPGAEQCGEWCQWCDDVAKYMRAMEDHADVIPLPRQRIKKESARLIRHD